MKDLLNHSALEVTRDDVMKITNAKTKRDAIVSAGERLNRVERLERLNARVRGRFRDFMTQAELKAMPAWDTCKAR